MSKSNVEHKISLWSQMQSMVMNIEERNHKMLGLSTITPTVFTLIASMNGENGYINQFFLMCIYAIMPLILLYAVFSGAFNNKYSALVRGYLAGLEESINKELGEEIFIWNKGYSELFHKRFFLTNDLISILYGAIVIIVPVFCFYNLFIHFECDILIIIYVAVYVAFLSISLFDLLTNGKSKKYARIYYFLHNFEEDERYNEFDVKDVNLIKSVLKRKITRR